MGPMTKFDVRYMVDDVEAPVAFYTMTAARRTPPSVGGETIE
jgi:hypothetical protein